MKFPVFLHWFTSFRNYILFITNILLLLACLPSSAYSAENHRDLWLKYLIKISDPVLTNLSESTLKENMPIYKDRSKYQYLEAFGRTICGIAPWIELGSDTTQEGKLREKYIDLIHKSFTNSLNPNSKDYLNFKTGAQPLVDAAYLSEGLIRAENWIWNRLSNKEKELLVNELKRTRRVSPPYNNWLLFASMVEACLLKYTGECDEHRLINGIETFFYEMYIGDGVYSDGDTFSMDYYNGYVIHPMLTDILLVINESEKFKGKYSNMLKVQLNRMKRYAAIQERMISPDGFYPVIGRTIICRFGVFHALSNAILVNNLSKDITYGQARSALTSVLNNQFKYDTNFDSSGFLKVGFVGNQESIVEPYVSMGSAYHCTSFFLPLGLPESHKFWAEKSDDWTSKKAWTGIDVNADHALHDKFDDRNKLVIFSKILNKMGFDIKWRIFFLLSIALLWGLSVFIIIKIRDRRKGLFK